MEDIPAVILARGGSKGIPRKNLMEIAGKSLVRRTAELCVESDLNPVYVYSDSTEILEEGQRGGAIGLMRPEEVSGDKTTSEETMLSFLLKADPGENFKAAAMVQCTTPFLKVRHLNKARRLFVTRECDSVVAATRMIKYLGYEKFNGHSAFIPLNPLRSLRQTMGRWNQWLESGAIYLATRKLWEIGRRIGEKCMVVSMSWWDSLEIDDPVDLEVARRLASLFLEGSEDCHGAEIEEYDGQMQSEDEEARTAQG
ncbi:MAG: acylneuraminate cytidylyltransferase family protein [Candidatus Latescibacterota bacterium]|nr:MAG: acylneuraminate cytidylyltransferase family protein [Candidatus Latescibacterota bacterium]